jgi:large subunit ribosomal protein L10
MPLTKIKKSEIVAEVAELLAASKMTVLAEYKGITVKSIQELRKQAKATGTSIQVVKNRLVVAALKQNETLKGVDTSAMKGQLLYAFNAEDEVAGAQALKAYSKLEPSLVFVGAITADGTFLSAEDVTALASLPSKDQLRGHLVATIAAPLTGFVRVVQGNITGLLNVLNARADATK